MQQIEATVQFARDRGDFEHPLVQQIRSQVPDWIFTLGSDSGTAAFNSEFQTELPETLQYYFRNPEIAALIHAGCDLDIFLNNLSGCVGSPPPFVLYHLGHPHIVVAFHNHSGGVAAADLIASGTPIRFGDIDADDFDLSPYDTTAVPFHDWIDSAIRNADYDQFHAKSRTFPVQH